MMALGSLRNYLSKPKIILSGIIKLNLAYPITYQTKVEKSIQKSTLHLLNILLSLWPTKILQLEKLKMDYLCFSCLSKQMNRAFPEKNVGNSNNIETPVQLLEFMKNFTQHPALVYRSAYTIFGTVTLWRFDALPATLESFKIWISDCTTQRKVQLWPVIKKNRRLLFFSDILIR